MAGRGVTVDFNANVARFTSGIDKATNDLAKFQSNADRIGKNINNTLAGLGVGLSAAGIVSFFQGAIDGLDKLNDLSKTTGLAVGQLSGLGLAAKQSGADLDSVANAISKLSVNIAKDGERFRALGITAKDPLEAFKQLADVFVAIKDPQIQAGVAAQALGKEWKTAAPLLSEGGAAIGRMVNEGEKLSGVTQEMTDQADKFNDQMAELKLSFDALGNTASANLLPILTSITKKMVDATRESGVLVGSMVGLKGVFSNIFSDADAPREQQIAKRLDDIGKSMDGILARRKQWFASSDFADPQLQALNKEALVLQNELAALQSAAAKPLNLPTPNAPSQSALSAFLGNDGPGKSAAAAALVASKKAAAEQAKIFKDGLDFEAHQAQEFYDARDKSARDAQSSLDSLMKSGQDLKLSLDPMAKMNSELERYSELLNAGAIDQKIFDLAVAKSGTAMELATKNSLDSLKSSSKDASDSLNAVLIGFQTNVQSNLGNGIFQVLNGDFTNIGNAWKTMLLRMVSDAAAANLANIIFGRGNGKGNGLLNTGLSILGSVLGAFGGGGGGGGLLKITSSALTGFAANGAYFDGPVAKFANGDIFNSPTAFKFASGGALRNGIMGEAGPEAIMPLSRDSSGKLGVRGGGGSKGLVINNNQVINIDSRSDRASIMQDIKKLNQISNAELMDKLV